MLDELTHDALGKVIDEVTKRNPAAAKTDGLEAVLSQYLKVPSAALQHLKVTRHKLCIDMRIVRSNDTHIVMHIQTWPIVMAY